MLLKEFKPEMVVWNADNLSKVMIKRVVETHVIPEGTPIRLGRQFFEGHSKRFIEWCQERGHPVFCDTYIIEEPAAALNIASCYLQHRPWMLSIMGSAGSTGNPGVRPNTPLDTLNQFVEACDKVNTRSCVITKLMSKQWGLADKEYDCGAKNQAMFYVDRAHMAGASHIVCDKWAVGRIAAGPDYYQALHAVVPNTQLAVDPENAPWGAHGSLITDVYTVREAIRDGVSHLMFDTLLTSGEGTLEECLARNYVTIRDRILDAIAETNAER